MEKQKGNEPAKPPPYKKGKRKDYASGSAEMKSPLQRAFAASSLDLPAVRTQSDMDLDLEQQMTDIRKRNAIYSKRKYYKKKMEVERLEGVKGELTESNAQLKAENARLESLLVEAQRQVSLLESAGSLVETATTPPPLGQPLYAAATQVLRPSREVAAANSNPLQSAALARLTGATEPSFLAGTLASSDPFAAGTFGGHLDLSSASLYPHDSSLAASLPFTSSSSFPAGDFLRVLRLQQQQLQQQTGLSSINAAAALSPNVSSLFPSAPLSTLHHLRAGATAAQDMLSFPRAAAMDQSFANQEDQRLLQLLASRPQQQSFMDSQRSLLSDQTLRSEFASLSSQQPLSLQQQLLEQRLLLQQQQQQQQRALSSQLGLQGPLGPSSYEGLLSPGLTYGNDLATELLLQEQQQRQGAIAQDMRPQPYQDLYSTLLQQVSQPEQALPGTASLAPGLPSSAMDDTASGIGRSTAVATAGTQNDNEALVRLVLERQRREREGPS